MDGIIKDDYVCCILQFVALPLTQLFHSLILILIESGFSISWVLKNPKITRIHIQFLGLAYRNHLSVNSAKYQISSIMSELAKRCYMLGRKECDEEEEQTVVVGHVSCGVVVRT